jgi:hypothetical protein
MAVAKKSVARRTRAGTKPAFRPDEAYVSDVAHKFVENRDDVGWRSSSARETLAKANSHTGQNTSPDRFDTVG